MPKIAANYRKKSDAALFSYLKEGNREAYAAIFDCYWPLLHRFVARMLQDEDEATDILQDVFTDLWEKRAHLAKDTQLKSLLYTMAKNRALAVIRHSKVKDRYFAELGRIFEEGVSTTDRHTAGNELAAKIEAELKHLPPKMREAFLRRRMEDQSIREISEIMGIADNTVKHHISRATKTLRKRLTNFIFFFL